MNDQSSAVAMALQHVQVQGTTNVNSRDILKEIAVINRHIHDSFDFEEELRCELRKQRQMVATKLPVMSWEPLRWRTPEGWPRVALFPVHSDETAPEWILAASLERRQINPNRASRKNWTWRAGPHDMQPLPGSSPKVWLELYQDVSEKLFEMGAKMFDPFQTFQPDSRWMTLRASFTGTIPSAVRRSIRRARSVFPDEVYLLAEVVKWDIATVAIPIFDDPLVLGFHRGNFHLIDSFDLTSAEEYIKREFTI